MKKFLGTRIGIAIVTILVCIIAFSGVAYAGTFSKDVPTTMTLKASAAGLTLYTSSAKTQELTNISFGEVVSGVPQTISVYVVNTGNKAYTGLTVSTTLDPAVGTVSFTGGSALAKGQATTLYLTFNTVELAEDILFNGVTSIGGNY